MAEIALTFIAPLIESAISKAVSFAREQVSLAWGLKTDLEDLAHSLDFIQQVLEDAERKQEIDRSVRSWLARLKDVAYEAADVLDEYGYELLSLKVKSRGCNQVHTFSCLSKPTSFSLNNIARNINKINESLNKIKSDASLLVQLVRSSSSNQSHHAKTNSIFDCSKFVGRSSDVSDMVELLANMGSSSQQPLSGISIVGFGGIGKTTLAKSICERVKSQSSYDVVAWVCVSEYFDAEKILKELLEYFEVGASSMANFSAAFSKLQAELEKKKILLVLDDVWEESLEKWNYLSSLLSEALKTTGNSIVVTTRINKVACMAMERFPMHKHDVSKLSDEDCWLIIEDMVLRSSTETSVPSELEAIGRDIARRCGGLPLVASVIGGTLSREMTSENWRKIRDDEAWIGKNENKILSILKLSFDCLPSPLKRCFSYCAIFPRDYVIEKDDLIHLWMAQEYLHPSEGSSISMEDVGDMYFNDLLSNSLFQVIKRDALGNIKSFKMHDIVHDLALFDFQDEILIWDGCYIVESFNVRHLRVKFDGESTPTIPRDIAGRLHSLFFEGGDVFCSSGSDLKSLRSLKLMRYYGKKLPFSFRGADISELPCFLDKLKCLRYLDISETEIKEIPKFINKLYMLQTFKFMNCWRLEKPPEEIENLVSLKHICFNDEKHVPAGIGSLTCLQTLELFAVGHERGYHVQELEHLSKLRGKLEIRNLENIRNREDAARASLCEKTALVELALVFGSDLSVNQCNHHSNILESLEPPSNLKRLLLRSYRGGKCPSWMSNCVGTVGGSTCLRNLSRMDLYDCPHLESIPSLSLSKEALLEIRRCNSLKSIEVSLVQRLIISDCVELAFLHFGPLVMKHLKEICIKNCGKLETLPMVSSLSGLEILELENCFNLKSIGRESSSSPKSLRELRISYCYRLTSIPSLDGCVSLERIRISYCQQLKSIEGEKLSSCMSLREFCIRDCSALTSIPSLDGLLYIEKIYIWGCSKLKSIKKESLSLYSRLRKVIVFEWHALTSLSILHDLSCLVSIHISDCKRLKSISGESLSSATHLRELIIDRCPALTSIPSLDGLSSVQTISIMNCQQLKNIEGTLSSSTGLQKLCITHCGLTKLPNGFPSLLNLSHLELGGFSEEFEELPDLSVFLSSSSSLEGLTLIRWNKLRHLPDWLGNLSSLKVLKLIHCNSLKHFPSMEAMRRLSKLEDLEIESCAKLNVVSEWGKITGVERVVIDKVTI